MLFLTMNPTTIIGGTTITGTAGVYNGDAVYGSKPTTWTLINYGALQGAGSTSFGVDLEAGGKVVNGANGSVVGLISGAYDGVVIRGADGALVNQGTISSTGFNGAYFGAAGTVTNGASGATTGLISGGVNGIAVVGGPGIITNFGRIEAHGTSNSVKEAGVLLDQGGTIANTGTIVGSKYNFSITGSTISGGGVGIVSSGPATITNSGLIDGGAGGIYMMGGTSGAATVTNFGTIQGGLPIDAAASNIGVTVVNHGAIQSTGVGITLPAFTGGAGNDQVVIFPGAVFHGRVDGGGGNNTLELAAGASAGVIGGVGGGDSTYGFVNFGVVNVDNGASWLFQSMKAATDTINLGAAQVEFSGTVEAGHTVAFTAGGATAKIDNVGQFVATITGFQVGDALDFAGVTADGVSYSPGTLTLLNGGIGFAQIAFTTAITNPVFSVTADASGTGTLVTEDNTPCYCRGTRILTDRGEVAVEDLAIGDRVVTLSGAAPPIRWIGFGRDLVTRRNQLARPIVVRRGALADNVPRRDLYLTHGHSLYCRGVLIPAEQLVNHRSIAWDETARVIEYYHIELDNHDVLFAEGAPAESYHDAGNRPLFQNTRPGSDPAAANTTFAPVLTSGELVETVWAELFERAGGRLECGTTDDHDLHLLVDGARVNPTAMDGSVYRFAVRRPPAATLQLRSRRGVPSLLGLSRSDHRPLGVAIKEIILHHAGIATHFNYDGAQFREGGCHRPEDGYCWTDGEFELPARFFTLLNGAFTLVVHTKPHHDMRYPIAARPAHAA